MTSAVFIIGLSIFWLFLAIKPTLTNEDVNLQSTFSYTEKDGTFFFKGTYFSISEALRKVPSVQSLIALEFFALDTIVIDRDINGIDFGGRRNLNVSIIAPNWIVMGNRTINLDGKPGESQPKAEQSQNGKPGLAGGNGGNFLGIYSSIIKYSSANLVSLESTLTVLANGGQGGAGQEGGDGIPGMNGRILNVTEVGFRLMMSWNRSWNQNHRIKDSKYQRWYQKSETCLRFFHLLLGEKGKGGGNGGTGGVGGKGGIKGSIELVKIVLHQKDDSEAPNPVFTHARHGMIGRGGKGGQGGLGGLDGDDLIVTVGYEYIPLYTELCNEPQTPNVSSFAFAYGLHRDFEEMRDLTTGKCYYADKKTEKQCNYSLFFYVWPDGDQGVTRHRSNGRPGKKNFNRDQPSERDPSHKIDAPNLFKAFKLFASDVPKRVQGYLAAFLQSQELFPAFSSQENNKNTAFPVSFTKKAGTVTYQGVTFFISDALSKLSMGEETFSNLELFALDTIIIDEDIVGIEFGGKQNLNLTIIAPNWVILGNRTINLDGKPGDNQTKANRGQNGRPGLAGGNGGNFLGIYSSFDATVAPSFSSLWVSASGGRGGDGQEGGDGSCGQDVRTDTPKYRLLDPRLWPDSWYSLRDEKNNENEKVQQLSNGKNCFFWTQRVFGPKGERGGDGGKGGVGGDGGLIGTITVIDLDSKNNSKTLKPIVTSAFYGMDGKGQKGGQGGLGGRTKFFEESVTYFQALSVDRYSYYKDYQCYNQNGTLAPVRSFKGGSCLNTDGVYDRECEHKTDHKFYYYLWPKWPDMTRSASGNTGQDNSNRERHNNKEPNYKIDVPVVLEKFKLFTDSTRKQEKGNLAEFVQSLNSLTASTSQNTNANMPLSWTEKNRILTFQGATFSIREALQKLPINGINLTALEFFALHTITIDDDIIGSEFAGEKNLNVTIIAPNWVVLGNRSINLDGKPAGPDDSQEEAEDGKNGRPGLAGGNGGNFLGIYTSLNTTAKFVASNLIISESTLSISVNGGRGGRGQDGGAGIRGTNGQMPNFSKVKHRILDPGLRSNSWFEITDGNNYKHQNIRTIRNSTSCVFSIHKLLGTKGHSGGDGGNGGTGGKGGIKGSITIVDLNLEEGYKKRESQKVLTSSLYGVEGEGGKEGRAGQKGFDGENLILVVTVNETPEINSCFPEFQHFPQSFSYYNDDRSSSTSINVASSKCYNIDTSVEVNCPDVHNGKLYYVVRQLTPETVPTSLVRSPSGQDNFNREPPMKNHPSYKIDVPVVLENFKSFANANPKQGMENLSAFLTSLESFTNSNIENVNADSKLSYSEKQGIATFQGITFSISEALSKVPAGNQIYTGLEFLAVDTIIIDDNINGIEFGGQRNLNVTIIAPNWMILGNRTINLDGKPGKSQPTAEQGKNGRPGEVGGNGGNFLGIYSSIDTTATASSPSLLVTANGGKGGDGQEGGDGKLGERGQDPDLSKVTHQRWDWNLWPNSWFEVTYANNLRNERRTECENWCWCQVFFGKPGGKGGDGGSGGVGGKGGLKGSITLVDLEEESKTVQHKSVVTRALDGVDGRGAKGGLGGLGGNNGDAVTMAVADLTTVRNKSCDKNYEVRRKPNRLPFYNNYGKEMTLVDIETGKCYSQGTSATCPSDLHRHYTVWVNRRYEQTIRGNTGNPGKDNSSREPQSPREPKYPIYAPRSLNTFKLLVINSALKKTAKVPFKFLQSLATDPQILNLYDILGLIDEFRGLETSFPSARKSPTSTTDPLLFYKEFKNAIENFIALPRRLPTEHKKAIYFLYTALLSKTTLLSAPSPDLIVNLSGYLSLAADHVTSLGNLRQAEARQTTIQSTNEEFDREIQDKFLEAYKFINNTIEPEIAGILQQIDRHVESLLQEIGQLKSDAEANHAQLIRKREMLKSQLVLRTTLSVFKGVGDMAATLGPVGAMASAAVGGSTRIAETFLLGDDGQSTAALVFKLPAAVQHAKDNLETAANRNHKKRCKDLDDQMAGIFKEMQELGTSEGSQETPELAQIEEKTKDLRAQIKVESEKKFLPGDQLGEHKSKQRLEKLKKEFTTTLETNLKNLNETKKNSKDKTERRTSLLKTLDKGLKCAQVASEMYNKFQENQAQIEELAGQVEAAQKNMERIAAAEKNIEKNMKPMLEGMGEGLAKVQKGLQGKSGVALDLEKWQVQTTLRDLKINLRKEFTKGMGIDDDLARSMEKLEDAMTTLIKIYDRLQTYTDQRKLANYIAAISKPSYALGSNAALFRDRRIHKAVQILELIIQSNAIINYDEMAWEAFKMWAFPRAKEFSRFAPSQSSPILQLVGHMDDDNDFGGGRGGQNNRDITAANSTIKRAAEAAVLRLGNMKASIEEYKATIKGSDRYLITSEFNWSENSTITQPFYIWPSAIFNSTIWDLLSGHTVYLKANAATSPRGKDSIKFREIKLQFRSRTGEKNVQNTLEAYLAHFSAYMTHLGNSFYRMNNEIYVMTSSANNISYSFVKDEQGQPKETNEVYKKLYRGDLLLSPYTLWRLQLVSPVLATDFGPNTQVYSKEGRDARAEILRLRSSLEGLPIDLELVGRGTFVRSGVDLNMHEYYQSVGPLFDFL